MVLFHNINVAILPLIIPVNNVYEGVISFSQPTFFSLNNRHQMALFQKVTLAKIGVTFFVVTTHILTWLCRNRHQRDDIIVRHV